MRYETIIMDGFKFTLVNGKKYHYNSTLRKYLHQYVWEKENGAIPEGYEIHHIDRNTTNNNIENLQLVTKEEHHLFDFPHFFSMLYYKCISGFSLISGGVSRRRNFCLFSTGGIRNYAIQLQSYFS